MNASTNEPNTNEPENSLLASRFPAELPVTGAWQVGDPPGDRRFAIVAHSEHPFALEGGGELHGIRVAYETWGELDESASNAVLVCHALTGDSHAAGERSHLYPAGGWWNEMIGPGRAIDTDRYFVVCSNVLGGCQGTTGPADTMPDLDASSSQSSCSPSAASAGVETGPRREQRRYGSQFPVVTIRDMVRVQALLADYLGVRCWLAVAGGSMGGMQVLEWAVMYPRRVRSILPLATCAATSPMQLAWSAVGRLAIAGDPHWNGGDYYEAACGPWRGLALARELAQVTYRSAKLFDSRFRPGSLRFEESLRALGALPGGVVSGSSWPEAGASFRRQHLHDSQQGYGLAQHRAETGRGGSGLSAHRHANAHGSDLQ